MKTRIKKVKTVSNNENANKTVVKKSNSKTNHLKDISNCFDMKAISEKDASEKSKNSKKINKTDTSSTSYSNTKMESVEYKEEQKIAKKILKNSTNFPNTDDNEAKLTKSVSFKDSEHRKSKRFYFNNNQSKTQSYSKSHLKVISNSIGIKVISEEDASENEVVLKNGKKMNKTDTSSASYSNTKIESVGYEEEQVTSETIIKNSTNLPDTDDNEAILTKSAKLEMECSSNSNCKHKRKLSKVEDVIQDYLKRIKSS